MPQPLMVGTRHIPLPATVKGIPRYVATPSLVTRKSGCTCSNTFFFGFSSASGVPGVKQEKRKVLLTWLFKKGGRNKIEELHKKYFQR